MLRTMVARYGNSLTVRLPAALARELDLREGDSVVLRRVDGGLTIEREPRRRLERRLATVRESEREIGAGVAMGAESFD